MKTLTKQEKQVKVTATIITIILVIVGAMLCIYGITKSVNLYWNP